MLFNGNNEAWGYKIPAWAVTASRGQDGGRATIVTAFGVVGKRPCPCWLCQVRFLARGFLPFWQYGVPGTSARELGAPAPGEAHVVSLGELLGVQRNYLTGVMSVVFWWYKKQIHSKFIGFQSKHFALPGEHFHAALTSRGQMAHPWLFVEELLGDQNHAFPHPVYPSGGQRPSVEIWWSGERMNEMFLCW